MLVPAAPPLVIVDLGVIPVVYMLIYQYFPDWKKFTIAISVNALLMAFIGEPIAVVLDIYQLNNWKYIYSFPLYIAMALILKWILIKILKNEDISSNRSEGTES